MADKSFGVKQVNLINASGTPRIESPNNLNINAVNVAISTDISVGGQLSLGTGTSISSPETNVLTLGTNNTERVRISSDGRVGIGTDNPLEELHITAATPVIRFEDSDTGGQSQIVCIDGSFRFDVDNANEHASSNISFRTDGSEKLRITSDGDTRVAAGSSLYLANGNLVFSTSGTGIDFSATADGTGASNVSELLDDYEEGTWTPTATNYGGTMQVNSASYVRVGSLCYIHAYVSFDSTTDDDNIRIGGLPFTGNDINNNYYLISAHTNGGLEELHLRAQGTTTQLAAVHLSAGNGDAKPSYTSLAGKFIIFGGCYRTT